MNFLSSCLITFSCSLFSNTCCTFKLLHSQYNRVVLIFRLCSVYIFITYTSFCNTSLLTVKMQSNICCTTTFSTWYMVQMLPTVKENRLYKCNAETQTVSARLLSNSNMENYTLHTWRWSSGCTQQNKASNKKPNGLPCGIIMPPSLKVKCIFLKISIRSPCAILCFNKIYI